MGRYLPRKVLFRRLSPSSVEASLASAPSLPSVVSRFTSTSARLVLGGKATSLAPLSGSQLAARRRFRPTSAGALSALRASRQTVLGILHRQHSQPEHPPRLLRPRTPRAEEPGMQAFLVATVTQTRERAEELRTDHPLSRTELPG